MAQDKLLLRLEAKLDALLKQAGIDPDSIEGTPIRVPITRKLTPAEQQAIDNAPKPTPAQPVQNGPRTDANNAPVVNVPPAKPAEPIPGYDDLNVAETLEALSDRRDNRALIAAALEYERANKRRAGVITQLVNWNS